MHDGGEVDCSAALQGTRRVLQDDPSVLALVVAGGALVSMGRAGGR